MFFEKYQKYKNTELIINSIRKNNTFNIAEINADSENTLSMLLPSDKITHFEKNADLNGLSFDIAVFVNGTEDCSYEEMADIAAKIESISSRLFIIGGIFSDYCVNISEMMNNIGCRAYMNEDNPIFVRNMYKKRPDLKMITDIFKCKFDVLRMGNAYIRDIIHNMYMMAGDNDDLANYARLVNDYYKNVTFNNDYADDGYMKLIIGKKQNFNIYGGSGNRADIDFYRNHYDIFSNMYNRYQLKAGKDSAADGIEEIKKKLSNREKYIEVSLVYEKNTVSRKYPLKTDGFSIEVDAARAKKAVIKPINGVCAVELKKLQIKKNGSYNDADNLNSNASAVYDKCYMFETDKPEFYIELNDAESISFGFAYLSENLSGINYIRQMYQSRDFLNGSIEKLNNKISDVRFGENEKLSRKDEEIGILKGRIEELENTLSQRDKELNEIKSSRAWKMTAPFRK